MTYVIGEAEMKPHLLSLFQRMHHKSSKTITCMQRSKLIRELQLQFKHRFQNTQGKKHRETVRINRNNLQKYKKTKSKSTEAVRRKTVQQTSHLKTKAVFLFQISSRISCSVLPDGFRQSLFSEKNR